MKRVFIPLIPPLFVFALLVSNVSILSAQKFAPEIENMLAGAPGDSVVSVMVTPAIATDISSMSSSLRSMSRRERHSRLVAEMKRQSAAGRKPIENIIEKRKSEPSSNIKEVKTWWITSQAYVTADINTIRKLAESDAVAEIGLPPKVELVAEKTKSPLEAVNELMQAIRADATGNATSLKNYSFAGATLADGDKTFNWGLWRINARDLWKRGLTGKGIIVANIDSGVDGTNPLLRDKWRGANGATAMESWYDPFNGSSFPEDDGPPGSLLTHGTRVMGAMLGQDGADTTGVAVDAQWIAANGFEFSGPSGLPEILDCIEWVADPDGDPNTADDLPDVLNCSWRQSDSGCSSYFDEVIKNVQDLGIIVIFAAGNDDSPFPTPGAKSWIFAVGAVDSQDSIARFSNRGPSVCDPSVIKPDVTAPGVGLQLPLGQLGGGGFQASNGTSFSAPLVSGLAAALKQYNPSLTPQEILDAIKYNADEPAYSPEGPDNDYGYGIVNGLAALNALSPGTSPAFSITALNISAGGDAEVSPGEEAAISLEILNYGNESGTLSGTLSTAFSGVVISNPEISLTAIGAGRTISTEGQPFVIEFPSTIERGSTVTFILDLTDGGGSYRLSFAVNVGGEPPVPTAGVETHNAGNIELKLTNYGIIGTDEESGGGVVYPRTGSNPKEHLFHGALLIGTGPLNISDASYTTISGGQLSFAADFAVADGGNIDRDEPGAFSDEEVSGAFTDKRATNPLGIRVDQKSYSWSDEKDNDFVIIEYALINTTEQKIDGLHVAQHLDWDISETADDDIVGYDKDLEAAYMYDNSSAMYLGHVLLTQQVKGFRAVNYSTDLSDGFSEAEKFSAMYKIVEPESRPDDWSEVLSAGLITLLPGDTVVVAFAIVGGHGESAFRENVQAARDKYRETAVDRVDIDPPVFNFEPVSAIDISDSLPQVSVEINEDLFSAKMHYRLAGEETFSAVTGLDRRDGSNTYLAYPPHYEVGTVLQYYFEAVDMKSNLGVAPEGAPDEYFTLTYVDTLPPVISPLIQPYDTDDTAGPYLVQMKINDYDSVARASLIFNTDRAAEMDTIEFETIDDTLYSCGIPGAAFGTLIMYHVEASDSSGNVSRLPEGAPDHALFQFSIIDSRIPVLSSVSAFVDSSDCNFSLKFVSEVLDDNLKDVLLVVWEKGQEGRDSLWADTAAGDSLYSFIQDKNVNGATYFYYFVAADSAGNVAYAPENAPEGGHFGFDYTSYVPGDSNLDGDVNIFDLLTMLQYLAGSSPAAMAAQQCAMDTNYDGEINIFDLLEILFILQG